MSENAEFIRRSQADAGQGPSVLQVGQASRKAIADGKAVGTLRATDGLPPGTSRSERREVESTIKEGLMGLDGELKGSYYGLYDMTPPQEKQLLTAVCAADSLSSSALLFPPRHLSLP